MKKLFITFSILLCFLVTDSFAGWYENQLSVVAKRRGATATYPTIEASDGTVVTWGVSVTASFDLTNGSGNNRALVCGYVWTNGRTFTSLELDPDGTFNDDGDEISFNEITTAGPAASVDVGLFYLKESELPSSSGTYEIQGAVSGGNASQSIYCTELSGVDQTTVPTASGTWDNLTDGSEPSVTFNVPDNMSLVLGMLVVNYNTNGTHTEADGAVQIYEEGTIGSETDFSWVYEEVATSGSNTISSTYTGTTDGALAVGASFKGNL